MLHDIIEAYEEAVFETDKPAALAVIDKASTDGMSAEDIVFKIIVPATEKLMSSIVKDPDANLAQHFMTAQIAAEATEKMLARFQHPPKPVGCIIVGTAFGDLHSLGKRIVSGCLKSLMVEVVDVGVNVRPEQFVDAALDHDAQVIGISSMMVHTAIGEQGCRKVREILQERQLENKIKLVVGGAPYRFDPLLYQTVGADAWAADGISAGKVIIELIKQAKQA